MSNKTTIHAVTVSPPWETTTFVPQGSFVHVSCIITKAGQTPTWSIKLSSSHNFIQFPIAALNQRGFHEVPQDDSDRIQLTVNNTVGNNGTTIRCIDGASLDIPTIHETNLHIYGK